MPEAASSLLQRLRTARDLVIPVGRWTFHARRPTRFEAGDLQARVGTVSIGHLALEFVCGWEGVRTCDIVGSGDDQAAQPFDSDLWREWASDHVEVLSACGEAIQTAYLDSIKKTAAVAGE